MVFSCHTVSMPYKHLCLFVNNQYLAHCFSYSSTLWPFLLYQVFEYKHHFPGTCLEMSKAAGAYYQRSSNV